MSNINTISEFLIHAGTDYRIFDMARGIRLIDSQQFLEIENGNIAAPYPRQKHAWFGVLFFNKQLSKEHYIWFVKLPLDERGCVLDAGRKQFLQIVVEALGAQLDKDNNPNNQLPENPFTFVPNQNLLADFNARSRQVLNIQPNHQYADIRACLSAPQSGQWQTLAVQEIADFCAAISHSTHRQLLIEQFSQVAPQLQRALCQSLENNEPPAGLVSALLAWYAEKPEDEYRAELSLRALSQSPKSQEMAQFLMGLVQSSLASSSNTLILISARHWTYLNDPELLRDYLTAVAELDTNLFAGLYPDLVQIPSIRHALLDALRWPDKSPALTQAIGALFGQAS